MDPSNNGVNPYLSSWQFKQGRPTKKPQPPPKRKTPPPDFTQIPKRTKVFEHPTIEPPSHVIQQPPLRPPSQPGISQQFIPPPPKVVTQQEDLRNVQLGLPSLQLLNTTLDNHTPMFSPVDLTSPPQNNIYQDAFYACPWPACIVSVLLLVVFNFM